MKLEAILDAMVHTKTEMSLAFRGYIDMDIEQAKRRSRQAHAFRARILRMFEELRSEADTVHEYYEGLLDEGDEVNRQQIRRIAELEKEVEYMEELYVLEHDTEPPKRKELSDGQN